MAGKPIYDIATAVEKHLDAFGVASPNLIRAFYPGLSLRAYTNAYQSVARRALAHFVTKRVLVSSAFKSSKQVPLDEAMMALGDALCLSLWSGLGEPKIGDKLDSKLTNSGLSIVDLPSRARLGFLGSGALFSDSGRIVIPCYLGCGGKSQTLFQKDIEERWLQTWHPVLALQGIQEVVIIFHGMLAYKTAAEKIRSLAKAAMLGSVHARIGGARLRALRGLRWNFIFLQMHKPPIGKVLADYHAFESLPSGEIRHAKSDLVGSTITPKMDRKWLWQSEDIM